MYSRFQLLKKYLAYYTGASNGKGHGMHSPFLFDFITKILNDKTNYDSYQTVEVLRKQLLSNQTLLRIEDFGAGSATNKSNERTISSIAKHAAKPPKYGKLLHRMVKTWQPNTILELGTSLGLTTSYLSLAAPGAKIITMEGAREVAAAAKKNFETLGLKNITIEQGNFDTQLDDVLKKLPVVDFAFIDGNHRKEPTENYFHALLSHVGNDSVLIFDDIHWSEGMEQAWKTIRSHPAVRCSVDLFFIGIVFFRQEFKEKQDFAIRF